jgi:hypothetical protein
LASILGDFLQAHLVALVFSSSRSDFVCTLVCAFLKDVSFASSSLVADATNERAGPRKQEPVLVSPLGVKFDP